MRKHVIIFSLLFSCMASAASIQAYWQSYSQMPAPRSNPVVVTYQNSIYVIGGNDINGATNTFWRFDPQSKKWQVLPSMLEKRFAHSGLIWQNKLYIFGGMSAINHYLDSIECYNFKIKKWSLIGKMPYANARFALVNYQGKILMLGGVNNSYAAIADIESYDVSTAKWQQFAKLPQPLNRLNAVNLNNHLYVFGGADIAGNAISSVWEYQGNNDWNKKQSLQNARQNFALTSYNNNVILTGGWVKHGGKTVYVASAEQYDPENNTMSIIGYMPQGRDGVRMVTLGNHVYLLAGYNKNISNGVQVLSCKAN